MLVEFIEKKTLPCFEIMLHLLRNFHQISSTLISVRTPFNENLPRFILSYNQFPFYGNHSKVRTNGCISRLIRTLLTKPSLILLLLSTLVREALLTLKISGLKKKLENSKNICTAFVDFPQRNVVISLNLEGSLDGTHDLCLFL